MPIVDGENASQCPQLRRNDSEPWIEDGRGSVTIGILPNDVLLEVFSFYVEEAYGSWTNHQFEQIHAWIPLVHVCQRWRDLAFVSSNRLNLRIRCTNKRPAKEILDALPTLPIFIWYWITNDGHSPPRMEAGDGADNIISALGYRDRVSHIILSNLPLLVLDRLLAAIREPFPALTFLEIGPMDGEPPLILQDSFLGGSAPYLRLLRLCGFRFSALPRILLSTNKLISLHLLWIPDSGYISPEEMATFLASLTSLEHLDLGFGPATMGPHPPIRHPPPTRVELPSLTYLWISGHSDYLDQFVARIDAPLLNCFEVVFFNETDLNILQLTEFIDRVERFKMVDRAEVFFELRTIVVTLSSQKETLAVDCPFLTVRSICEPSEWQFLHLAQVHSSFVTLLSSLESLSIVSDLDSSLILEDEAENVEWLQLLFPFPAVKDLSLSGVAGINVARALREVDEERVTVVLPALQRIFLDEPPPSEDMFEAIHPFRVARLFSGYPVTIDYCQEEADAGD